MLFALALTVVIECIVIYFIMKSVQWIKYSIYCNFITNPLLNFIITMAIVEIYSRTFDKNMITLWMCIMVMEAGVFGIEGLLYYLMSDSDMRTCFKCSIVANVVSVLCGFFWQMLTF